MEIQYTFSNETITPLYSVRKVDTGYGGERLTLNDERLASFCNDERTFVSKYAAFYLVDTRGRTWLKESFLRSQYYIFYIRCVFL